MTDGNPFDFTAADWRPDPLVSAPLSSAARHQPAARDDGQQTDKKKFKAYPIGFFHIDIAEVQHRRGQALPLCGH